MSIRYIDGRRLQRVFIAAANWVNARRDQLNAINVFPVPDGDAGTNMAATLSYGVDGIAHMDRPSLHEVREVLGKAVLVGARGNSGFILAQFTRGFLEDMGGGARRIHRQELAGACQKAFQRAYEAVMEPVEGTILTVMREWSRAVASLSGEPNDLGSIFDGALERARLALARTKEQLDLLKKHDVVDAGAQGFVHMLEGISEFIRNGTLHPDRYPQASRQGEMAVAAGSSHDTITYRYCTQLLLGEPGMGPEELKSALEGEGDSLIVGGGEDMMKIHIHTDSPESVIAIVEGIGTLLDSNVEDMWVQAEAVASARVQVRTRTAVQTVGIVMDSTCDLPPEMAAEAGIRIVPCLVAFGDEVYKDQVDITPARFYQLLKTHPNHPMTSQPSVGDVADVYEAALGDYEQVLSVHLSGKLSGTYQAAVEASREVDPERISVVDTGLITVTMGLIGLKLAQRAREGMCIEELIYRTGEMVGHSRLYCVLETIECLIKGGRISRTRGRIGQTLGLLPILTLQDGLLVAIHKVRSSEKGFEEVFRRLDDEIPEGTPMIGASAHGLNPEMAGRASEEFRRRYSPVEMVDVEIGPAVGAHAGPGAWGLAYLGADTI